MKKYIFLVLASLVFSGCEKFLDVTPKGKFIPKTLKDYQELAANPSYSSNGYALLEVFADQIYLSESRINGSINTSLGRAYTWQPATYVNPEADSGWDPMYNNIFNANIILQNVPQITDGSAPERAEVMGDAYFNRAYAYWNLVNTYAKDYQSATAATDLGVPLVLIPDLEATPSRATVAAVYQQILDDLLKAKDILPDAARNIYRNNKTAALALLARVYLSMDNYSEAGKYAALALEKNNTLLDYNTFSFKNPAKPYSGINNKPVDNLDPEMLSYKATSFSTILSGVSISPDYLSVLDAKDLRYVFNFTNLDFDNKPTREPYPPYLRGPLNYNIGVPEMMLIRAEAAARSGDVNTALQLMNTLRKKRFKPADYTDLTAANADQALKLVIDERKRELFGKGLRWFDMKRLDNESLFKKTYKRANIGLYQLEPGSNRFVLQIPPNVQRLNPNITINPR